MLTDEERKRRKAAAQELIRHNKKIKLLFMLDTASKLLEEYTKDLMLFKKESNEK